MECLTHIPYYVFERFSFIISFAMTKRKRDSGILDSLQLNLRLISESTLEVLGDSIDSLLEEFESEERLLSQLQILFSNDLEPAIMHSVGSDPIVFTRRLKSLSVHFSSDLLGELSLEHRSFLICCMTDWSTISLEFECRSMSLVDLHRCLTNLPLIFVSAIYSLTFKIKRDRHHVLFSLATLRLIRKIIPASSQAGSYLSFFGSLKHIHKRSTLILSFQPFIEL